MPSNHVSARHIEVVDSRYVIDRPFEGRNLVSIDAFPTDPSEFLSDKVWIIDWQAKRRRQPGIVGTDGQFPSVAYRTSGTKSWNIPIYGWLARTGNIETETTDKVLRPRQRNLDWAHDKARLDREIRACQKVRSISDGIVLGAGSRFDDISSSSSDPIAVFQLGAERVKRRTGRKVDYIPIPEPAFRKLMQHEKVMQYGVSKRSLNEDRQICASLLEFLIGADPERPENGLIMPGSIKLYDFTFNNTPDSPSATAQENNQYPLGNYIPMIARAKPGGSDGSDNGYGVGKYLAMLEGNLEGEINIRMGNEGIGVFEFPDYDLPGGGTKEQLLDAIEFWEQNGDAGYLISGVVDSTNTDEYQTSMQF